MIEIRVDGHTIFEMPTSDAVTPLLAEIARLKLCVEETASGPLSEEAMDIAYSKIAAQRRVLEQALEALNLPSLKTQAMLVQRDDAIKAIVEVLK